MSGIAGKFCKYSSSALTGLNTGLMLAVCWRLHYVMLNQAGSTAIVLSMPSIVLVLLAVFGLALLIGSNWIRPLWLRIGLSLVWLVVSSLLLLKLIALPMSTSADGATTPHPHDTGSNIGKTRAVLQSSGLKVCSVGLTPPVITIKISSRTHAALMVPG